MVTMATGQSSRLVAPRVVKALKYGRAGVRIPLENMVGTVVNGGRLRKCDCVRWILVQVSSSEDLISHQRLICSLLKN